MKFNLSLTLVIPALAVALTGCEIKKTADDMKKTTRRVEASSKHLEKSTADLRDDMTYDRSDAVMTERLEKLFGERAADNLGPVTATYEFFFGLKDEADLCKAAEVTVLAMWWQFWRGDYSDTIEELDSRFALTLKSMFATLFKHVPRDGNVDPWWPRPDRSYRGVAALGTSLDAVSKRFKDALATKGIPETVFYDLIVEALRNRRSTVRNERFPKAAAEVLNWEQEAIYLLQLRQNALPYMVVTRMTDLLERGDARRFWMSITGQDVNLSLANPQKLKEWTIWLERAAKTRADLKSIGIEPQYNSMIAKIVGRVNFGQKAILARGPALVSDERAQLEARFARTYVNVSNQAFPPSPEPLPGRTRQGESGSGGGRRR